MASEMFLSGRHRCLVRIFMQEVRRYHRGRSLLPTGGGYLDSHQDLIRPSRAAVGKGNVCRDADHEPHSRLYPKISSRVVTGRKLGTWNYRISSALCGLSAPLLAFPWQGGICDGTADGPCWV